MGFIIWGLGYKKRLLLYLIVDSAGWVLVRDGVWRKPLAVSREKGVQMDLVRLEPDFLDKPHVHNGFEWVFVLDGWFEDSRGVHRKGDFVVNTTEGVHQPKTGKEGCLLLIVWTGSVSEV